MLLAKNKKHKRNKEKQDTLFSISNILVTTLISVKVKFRKHFL